MIYTVLVKSEHKTSPGRGNVTVNPGKGNPMALRGCGSGSGDGGRGIPIMPRVISPNWYVLCPVTAATGAEAVLPMGTRDCFHRSVRMSTGGIVGTPFAAPPPKDTEGDDDYLKSMKPKKLWEQEVCRS